MDDKYTIEVEATGNHVGPLSCFCIVPPKTFQRITDVAGNGIRAIAGGIGSAVGRAARAIVGLF